MTGPLDRILADHAARCAEDPATYEKETEAWVLEANSVHDPEELKALVVALENEVARLRAGTLGPALQADVERLAGHADSVMARDFPSSGDRHFVDGVHSALAWVLGWNDQPELPEPQPECRVCNDNPPVGRPCPGCREWSE